MLNELYEYEYYTYDLNNEAFERLYYKNLVKKGEINSIERPLVIIARHFLFLEHEEPDENDIAFTKEALKAWMGFDHESDERLEQIDHWLLRYIKRHIDNSPKIDKTTYKKIEEDVLSKETVYTSSWFENKKLTVSDRTSTKNTSKAITFDKIIAMALDYGPLKEYALYCDCNPEELFENIKINLKKLNKKQKASIIKLTIALLLSKRYESQKLFILETHVAANYMCKKADDVSSTKNSLYRYHHDNDSNMLFIPTQSAILYQINPKYRICESFIKHFKIVDLYDQNELNGCYYEDKKYSFDFIQKQMFICQ